jgi:hypothetical protein
LLTPVPEKENPMRDLRTLIIGLLLGACVTLSLGNAPGAPAPAPREPAPAAPAPAPRPAPAAAYQFTAARGVNGAYDLVILDHRTGRLYHRTIDDARFAWRGVSVEELLGDRRE